MDLAKRGARKLHASTLWILLPLALVAAPLAGCGDRSADARAASGTMRARVEGLAIVPPGGAVTIDQPLELMASTDDRAGLAWQVHPSGAAIEPRVSESGQPVRFLAPRRAGIYTVTATPRANPSGTFGVAQRRSVRVSVTDLAGVLTYHDDLARNGANEREYALTPADVGPGSFGKLFSCGVDGAIYAQPLWAPHLEVNGRWRNVVFIATAHDSLYAFDADESPCVPLWRVSLIDRRHGSDGGETPVPAGSDLHLVGKGDGDITPEVGVIGTPVIDPQSHTLYVVSKSVVYSAGLRFHLRLHAIDVRTGAEQPGSPVEIRASAPRQGGASVRFAAREENQRAGLALLDGVVYVAFGSHEDGMPFYGWLLGYRYDGAAFRHAYTLNTAPDAKEGGIWMGGAAPAADAEGELFVVTGNGGFDAEAAQPPHEDYGDSVLKLAGNLKVLQYFTPSDQHFNDVENNDFGSGGVVLASLPASSPVKAVAVAVGKDGELFVLDCAHLGGYGDEKAWQEVRTGTEKDVSGAYPGLVFSEGALWKDRYYLTGAGEPLEMYRLDPRTAHLIFQASASVPRAFGYPGATPAVSSRGDDNGIVWVLDNRRYCTPGAQGCGPAVLRAYDATTLRELWESPLSGPGAAGNAVKFTVPTIANGKVYVGTRGDNTGGVYGSTPVSGELDVYGLKAALGSARQGVRLRPAWGPSAL